MEIIKILGIVFTGDKTADYKKINACFDFAADEDQPRKDRIAAYLHGSIQGLGIPTTEEVAGYAIDHPDETI